MGYFGWNESTQKSVKPFRFTLKQLHSHPRPRMLMLVWWTLNTFKVHLRQVFTEIMYVVYSFIFYTFYDNWKEDEFYKYKFYNWSINLHPKKHSRLQLSKTELAASLLISAIAQTTSRVHSNPRPLQPCLSASGNYGQAPLASLPVRNFCRSPHAESVPSHYIATIS